MKDRLKGAEAGARATRRDGGQGQTQRERGTHLPRPAEWHSRSGRRGCPWGCPWRCPWRCQWRCHQPSFDATWRVGRDASPLSSISQALSPRHTLGYSRPGRVPARRRRRMDTGDRPEKDGRLVLSTRARRPPEPDWGLSVESTPDERS